MFMSDNFHNTGAISKSKTGNINYFHVFVRGHFPLFATTRPRELFAETANYSQLYLLLFFSICLLPSEYKKGESLVFISVLLLLSLINENIFTVFKQLYFHAVIMIAILLLFIIL